MSAVCANLLEEQPEGLPLGSFDVIFSKLAFHHIPDCGAMVKAVAPYLAPGGRLLILVRAPRPPSALLRINLKTQGCFRESIKRLFKLFDCNLVGK